MDLMKSLGFHSVYNLFGGIDDWLESGLPVISPTDESPNLNNPTQSATSTISEQAKFSVSNLGTDPPVPIPPDSLFHFYVMVTNEGNQTGFYEADIEVVELADQVYEVGTLTELVELLPGESKIVNFEQIHLPEGVYEASIESLNIRFEAT